MRVFDQANFDITKSGRLEWRGLRLVGQTKNGLGTISMIRFTFILTLFIGLAWVARPAEAGLINISLVTVGDPGNPPDPLTGLGSVSNTYSIGTYDVTMYQYAAYLNAVATTGDPYGVYNSNMFGGLPTIAIKQTSNLATGTFSYSVIGNGNVPVVEVNWGDAARFVNWLQNGQPVAPEGPGTTETGTYALNGGTSNAALMAVTRSTTATWVLPSSNEWYKAAYYSGVLSTYYQYATQSDSTPSNVLSSTGTNNANFIGGVVAPPTFGYTDYTNYVTQVGAFAASPSHYGTFDQSGNVYQWNETANSGVERGLRGGSYDVGATSMVSTIYDDTSPTGRFGDVGFRVANVPEPSASILLFAAGASGLSYVAARRGLKLLEKGLVHGSKSTHQNWVSAGS
jgi:formylglycine-generating enzyme